MTELKTAYNNGEFKDRFSFFSTDENVLASKRKKIYSKSSLYIEGICRC